MYVLILPNPSPPLFFLQVILLKQEKVACLVDNAAHLATDKDDPYQVQTKPHGHGDVHALLHSSGTAHKWKDMGFKWVCFFQVKTVRGSCVWVGGGGYGFKGLGTGGGGGRPEE